MANRRGVSVPSRPPSSPRRGRVLVAATMGIAVLLGCQSRGAENPLALGDHWVDVPGARLHYHVRGKGPICILHPGGPGLEWKYARMPELEEFLTLVYLDPRGAGASPKPLTPDTYTFANYAADLEALRARLGYDRVLLLGHSHGGMIALVYALAHPDHLSGLILSATSPTTGPEWSRDIEANLKSREPDPRIDEARAAAAEESRATTDAELARAVKRELPLYFYRFDPFRARMEPILRDLRVSVDPLRQFSREAAGFDVRPRLAEIRTPTLILAGRHDFICSPQWAEVLHRGIAGSRLVVLEESGHFLYMEEAVKFAAAVRDFAEGARRR